MEQKQLVMVITREGRFIGKMSREDADNAVGEDNIAQVYLEDACTMHDVITQNGVMVAAMYMGDMNICIGAGSSCLVCAVNSNSSYYSTYYQSVSNLQVAPSIKQ